MTLPFITFEDKAHFGVLNMTFEGHNVTDGAGIQITNGTDFQIAGNLFLDIAQHALHIVGQCQDFSVESNVFLRTNVAPLLIFGFPGSREITGFLVANNTLMMSDNNGKIGVAFASNGTIADNYLYNCTYGVGTRGVSDLLIKNNRMENCTDYGIYLTLPGMGFGDIATVPAPWMKNPMGIRGVQEWYMATVSQRAYIRKVFEQQCEVALQNIDLLARALGDRVQVAFVTGTDFGTQRGLFCSVQTYRELYKPFHLAVNTRIHELTKWKTFIHSCGAVYPLITEFITAGFDVLNPVQCSAKGMDPRTIKREFGRDIVFWGGGVDTQKTLPFGTPEEVYREVRERIEIFNDGGGFVFSSTHNVQSNVPLENMLAMFRAVNDSRTIARGHNE